jgi:hypothetical protein
MFSIPPAPATKDDNFIELEIVTHGHTGNRAY